MSLKPWSAAAALHREGGPQGRPINPRLLGAAPKPQSPCRGPYPNPKLPRRKKAARGGDASDSDYSASEGSGDEGDDEEVPPPPPESDGPQSEEGSEGDRLRPEQELSDEDDEQAEADRAVEVGPQALYPRE